MNRPWSMISRTTQSGADQGLFITPAGVGAAILTDTRRPDFSTAGGALHFCYG